MKRLIKFIESTAFARLINFWALVLVVTLVLMGLLSPTAELDIKYLAALMVTLWLERSTSVNKFSVTNLMEFGFDKTLNDHLETIIHQQDISVTEGDFTSSEVSDSRKIQIKPVTSDN